MFIENTLQSYNFNIYYISNSNNRISPSFLIYFIYINMYIVTIVITSVHITVTIAAKYSVILSRKFYQSQHEVTFIIIMYTLDTEVTTVLMLFLLDE